mgnify:CR=1 FL=1
MNNKKIKAAGIFFIFAIFVFGLYSYSKEEVLADTSVCLIGHKAPEPREYKWTFVNNNGDSNCVFDSKFNGLKCRYPAGIGNVDVSTIMQRICQGKDSKIIFNGKNVKRNLLGWTQLTIGAKSLSNALPISLHGLVEKVLGGYKLSPGNIILSENPPLTKYVDKSVYPTAKTNEQSILVELDMGLWKLSEQDKKTLANVNLHLLTLAEKRIEATEKHEEEHWRIFNNRLDEELNVINNLPSVVEFPEIFKDTVEASKSITDIFGLMLRKEKKVADKDNKNLDAAENVKYIFDYPLPIPNTNIKCRLPSEADYIVWVNAVSSASRKGVLEFQKDLINVVTYSGSGSGSDSKYDEISGTAWKDIELTLVAKPINNSKFLKWGALNKTGCPCDGQTNPVCKFTTQKKVNCLAFFE